jgi:predicted nucleic acid-binding protein
MIVLVESNFVLELAFRQEELADAEGLVALAEAGKIQLVVPACALFEPYETLVRRRKERDVTLSRLRNELRQLARSEAFTDLSEPSKSVTRALAESSELEAEGLEKAIRRLLGTSTVLPLSGQIISNALAAQAQFQLEPQDAIVFASVDQHVREQGKGTKVFANKNHNGFLKPDIETHFQQYGCKLLPEFSDARRFIEREIRQGSPRMASIQP